MLPSSGLFKDIVCPYFNNTAGCQRPYCHFRHAKNGDVIEQLNDKVIEEALSAKQFNSAQQSLSREPERIQECHYKPTPLSLLRLDRQVSSNEQHAKTKPYCPTITTKNEVPIYIPSSITHNIKSKSKEENVVSLISSHYIPSLCNGSKRDEEIIYTPSSSKHLHKNSNTYEPHNSASTEDNKNSKPEVIQYKPSSSTNLNKNVNTYEPDLASLAEIKKAELAYKPSTNTELYQHNDEYRPHGSSSQVADYQPSKTACKKRTSPNILNEISNISDDKQSSPKKQKLNIDLDNFQNEFDLIDEILCASNDSQTSPKDKKSTTVSSIDKKSNSSRKSNKTESKRSSSDKHRKSSSPKKSSSSNDKSKHKTSSHHSSSSKTKHGSGSSGKDSKVHSKLKTKSCDKQLSHQSKAKHQTKDKTSSKNTSSSEKSKNKRSHDVSSSHSKNKRKDTCDNSKVQTVLTEDDFLFSDDERELDRPINSTDLKDPIVLECLRISEEYNNSLELFKNPTENLSKTTISEPPEAPISIPKKRIAHSAANTISRPLPSKQVKKFTPATTFVERYKKILETQRQEELEDCEKRLEAILSSDAPTTPLPSRVQSISSISQLKSNLTNNLNNRPTLAKPIPTRIAHIPKNIPVVPATAQTLKKGTVRTAHVPNPSVLKKMDASSLLDLNNCRIPSNVRLPYLNYITEACLVLHNNDVVRACEMARHEELLVAKKCMNIKVYKNSCLSTILKIRKSTKESQCPNSTPKKVPDAITYESLTAVERYNMLKPWLLTPDDMRVNAYPIQTSTKGHAIVFNENKVFIEESEKNRQCSRCPKSYKVDDHGIPLIREDCTFHPKKCYRRGGRSIYGCCGAEGGSEGCSHGDHVIDGILGPDVFTRTGFVQTLQKPEGHPANFAVFAIDCEMVYTTKGIELARVTVVNDALQTVYDTFVKPNNYILDYATVFSGITEEMLRDVDMSIVQVQAVLLNMFSDTTILVGHSLESDLKALKLIHRTVIDTSILFPHKAGPPYKRALKNLANEHLHKIIQEAHGHDSAEDARISLELVLWKLRNCSKIPQKH